MEVLSAFDIYPYPLGKAGGSTIFFRFPFADSIQEPRSKDLLKGLLCDKEMENGQHLARSSK